MVGRVVEVAPRRAPRTTGAGEQTVLFLHGRGQGPDSVHPIAEAFATARIVAPEGGVGLRRGTTWFENESIGLARRDSVEQAEERLLGWLDGYVEMGCRPLLCGFSNGGAFAGYMLMRHPARFAGAALLSAPLVLPPWEPDALRGRPVFYGRGDRDPVVPREMFEAAEAYLADVSGGIVMRRLYDIGHEVAPREARDVAMWFTGLTD